MKLLFIANVVLVLHDENFSPFWYMHLWTLAVLYSSYLAWVSVHAALLFLSAHVEPCNNYFLRGSAIVKPPYYMQVFGNKNCNSFHFCATSGVKKPMWVGVAWMAPVSEILIWWTSASSLHINTVVLKSLFLRNSRCRCLGCKRKICIVHEWKIAVDANNKNHGSEPELNPGLLRGN